MVEAREQQCSFILLKSAKGKLTIGKSKPEDIEMEAGSILSSSGSTNSQMQSMADSSPERNLLLKSLDVRHLTVKCNAYDVELISPRHAFLLLGCRDFGKRLLLYKDFETLEALLRLRSGDLLLCTMENGQRLPARLCSLGQFSPRSLAIHFDVELEGGDHFAQAQSDTRLLVSVDQLTLPSWSSSDRLPPNDDAERHDWAMGDNCQVSQCSAAKAVHYFTSDDLLPPVDGQRLDSSAADSAYVPCIDSSNLAGLIGKNRGIQGSLNSCYMDAALFSMFSTSDIFDSYFLQPCRGDGCSTRRRIVDHLKKKIIYQLRRNFFVSSDRVMEFRRLLSDYVPEAKGFTEEEKDPEEFLQLLFGPILKAQPEIVFSSGQSSYLLQLLNVGNASAADGDSVVTVQQLLERSVFDLSVLLQKVPTRLVLQIPRYGKKKLFRAVVPTVFLNISNVLLSHPHTCWACGRIAQLQCKECYLVCTKSLANTFFCTKCFHEFHSGLETDQDHAVVILKSQPSHVISSPATLTLSSVLCIESSHYVSFSRIGQCRNSADWIFFDSMADRQGGTDGHNLPEVKHCPGLDRWLSPDGADTLMEHLNADTLPTDLNRLISDCYLCFYHWPDGLLYN